MNADRWRELVEHNQLAPLIGSPEMRTRGFLDAEKRLPAAEYARLYYAEARAAATRMQALTRLTANCPPRWSTFF